ncbi:hypothetical protein [Siphonobacter curvatus]|uniref:Uncharacterized protein n=1 Tax=Siphonobacter curvatus TaxID=2094562 RepID=A0A2S7IH48_9BACT|nr:hypothetical protein [Siphonobacter curvatus]PQA55011.1 hypothetical protein C5O19_20930 [Siphonobacter curvatus]
MPRLSKEGFKHNAKIFEKTCQWCGTPFFASRSTAKFCSSTCRAYSHQADTLDTAAPWQETERTVDALLHQIAFLKSQIESLSRDNLQLRQALEKQNQPEA